MPKRRNMSQAYDLVTVAECMIQKMSGYASTTLD
jgi:hypothetical protein